MRVLIAFSDTGGGHRAAATAIRDGLVDAASARWGENAPFNRPLDVTLVDPYAMTSRWPFDRLSAAYPVVVNRAPWIWRSGFALTNTTRRTATLQMLAWPALRRTFHKLTTMDAPDLIVSTHPLLTTPLRRVFPRTPLAVVVTDLVSGHDSWYQRCADVTIVPTDPARDRALRCGVSAGAVHVIGVPVSPHFVSRPGDRNVLRTMLGWSVHRPTIMLIGGGDGVGPLEQILSAIDSARLPCDVAVVTGRNAALAERLRARKWLGVVHVYGFVDRLGEMMRASSALVTKAGPGTISEAYAAGCPMLLYGAIPGQESGNVDYVCNAGAGKWTPSPEAVVGALSTWFANEDGERSWHEAARACTALARPDAARLIANRLLDSMDTFGTSSALCRICLDSPGASHRRSCSAGCSRSANFRHRTQPPSSESSQAAS